MDLFVYDPTQNDKLSKYRGGGRVIQLLKENLPPDTLFSNKLTHVEKDCTMLIPCWYPFQPPLIRIKRAKKQILLLFDVIPQMYPEHFPAGLRGRFYQFWNTWNLRYFNKIITISEHSKNEISSYFSISKSNIDVIHLTTPKSFLKQNSSKVERIHPNLKRNNYILYVGDVNWNKNLPTLGRALKHIKVPCVFVGSSFQKTTPNLFRHPWQKSFKEFIEITNTLSNTVILGYVDDEKLKTLYSNALCNILVSHDEGFGLSYIEASSQSCPSVLSDIDVFHETADDSALFVNRNNSEDIAQTINTLSQNHTRRDVLGNKAYKRFTTYFAPTLFSQALLKTLIL